MNKTLTLSCCFLLAGLSARAQALTGTVTVGGTTPTYSTLTAAVTALQSRGVGAGGVTLAVRPGTYAERITLTTLTGSSAANPVRFVGRGGTVTLRPVGTNANTDAAVTITACDYITLDSLNVADGGTSGADQVEVGYSITGTATKGSTHVTISNCSVRLGGGTAPSGSSSSRGVQIVSVATTASGANNFNRILNVQVDKAARGIQLSGQPTFRDQGNEVRGCVLGGRTFIGIDGIDAGARAIGISAAEQRAVRLLNNRIDSVLVRNSNPLPRTSISGIGLDNVSGRLEGNRISYVRFAGEGLSLAQGIRASVIDGDTLKVFNNFVGGISRINFTIGPADNALYALGIWLNYLPGGGGLTQVFHNTIVLPAAPTPVGYSSAGFHMIGGVLVGGIIRTVPAELRNNIIINRLSTSVNGHGAFAIVDGNSARGNLTSDTNVLLAPGTNGSIGQTGREDGGTRITSVTLAEWRTNTGTDARSISKAVAFINEAASDLHLAGASVGDRELAGNFLAAVNLDIDGASRSRTAPYIGADEASVPLRNAEAKALALGLQAYPNPALSAVNVRYVQPLSGFVRITVVDALGRSVQHFTTLPQAAGAQQRQLDMAGLADGVYVVQVAVPAPGNTFTTASTRVSIVR
ncbi:T9SS type A sorting domain-containing protein [Hymenobacter sp. BT664]|uniref:T9SS type A sorting domain-containing protein n=1 Tax=Hymenobacter montanus TaxID=2771359 RepID=A0A927GHQ2_9BACT|nr:T9SS type A sorting domain-containing protein [Hymenobacter montanus]MBD2766643.1 T9SS type A sorting domain-containing protein [Hymenobacter montanus]